MEDCDLMGTSVPSLYMIYWLNYHYRKMHNCRRSNGKFQNAFKYSAESFMNWRMNMNVPTMATFAEEQMLQLMDMIMS